jgi:hypothetical protein
MRMPARIVPGSGGKQLGLCSLRKLIPDRQRTYSFAASCVDRICQRGRNGGQAGLTYPTQRFAEASWGEQMRVDLRRRGVDSSHLVTVEIRLLNPSRLEANLADGREANALHNRPFELRADTIRIDDGTTIEGDIHPRN